MSKFSPLLALALGSAVVSLSAAEKPDILMIAVDDLNDMLTLYDPDNPIKTPNLERLAARGTFFARAYSAAPICNPSRMALLAGQQPVTTGIYGNEEVWSQIIPERELLPQFFQRHGYETVGVGKILHHNPRVAFDREDWPLFERYQPMVSDYQRLPFNGERRISGIPNDAPGMRAPVYDWGEYHEQPIDVDTVEFAEGVMAEQTDKPRFLGVGIYRPHIPFWAPPENFARYPFDTLYMPPRPANDFDDIPAIAMQFVEYLGFQFRYVTEQSPGTPGSIQTMVQSYFAAADFADEMVGRVLDALDASGRADNTIIVLWSDHGFHLGDKNVVTKHTLWERANRAPFIIVAPGVSVPGGRVDAPVSLVDLFPTLIELAGYEVDPAMEFDGESLVEYMRDPENAPDNPRLMTLLPGNHAIRSKDFRYIVYSDGSEELYDHCVDPWEWTNLAGNPDYADVIRRHRQYLPVSEAPRGIVVREYERQKRLASERPEPPAADATFRKVIHWDMSETNADGFIRNRINDGPYADNYLMPMGAALTQYPGKGQVLAFDGVGDAARSTMALGLHAGVRITLRLKNESDSGQSVIFGMPGLQIYKVSQSVRMRADSFARPHWGDNEVGVTGLQSDQWRTVTAEFNPTKGKVWIQSDERFAEMDLEGNDTLAYQPDFIRIGERINTHFEGKVAEIMVEILD